MRRGGEAARRGFSLLELLAVVVVVSLAAGIVLPRVTAIGSVRARATAARLADRLSAARELAILGGRAVRVDLREGLPPGVRLVALERGGAAATTDALTLEPDGDALPATVTLGDERGARVAVVVPAGFAPARVREDP